MYQEPYLYLKNFELTRFHNLKNLSLPAFKIVPQWIFIVGDTASGKTSLLQALAAGLSICPTASDICEIEVCLEGNTGVNLLFYNESRLSTLNKLWLVKDISQRLRPKGSFAEFGGIVLIDEVELYLNPRAQRILMWQLVEYFPRVQFIVTTNSPLILLGTPYEYEILKLSRQGSVTTLVWEKDIQLHRLMPNSILTSPLFGLTMDEISGE